MNIISKANIGNGDTIYTVQLAPNTFVDVKHCWYEGLYYVMQCEDGWEVFNQKGCTIPEYEFNEAEVLSFVKQYVSKNQKRVVQISLDIVIEYGYDGYKFAEEAAKELSNLGFDVVGAGFQEDVSMYYEEVLAENANKCS